MEKTPYNKKLYAPLKINDWEVFKFTTFKYFYKWFHKCWKSDRYQKAISLYNNVHAQLDMLEYIKILGYCRS
jgi:hypothetical protein